MKTKCFAMVVVLVILSLGAVAQDTPKAEVFGGYQYTRLDGGGSGANFNGWNGALTGNINKWLGVTSDFSGAYKTVSGVSVKQYTFTFGPVLAARHNEKFTPYVHALFGGFHASGSAGGSSISTNGFAMLIGGGVDAKLTPHLALRAVQFDWMSLHAEGSTENNNFRISTGLVFRF